MKILVTGGAGFIGSYVLRELIREGHQSISYDIVPPREKVEGVNYVTGTVMDQYLLSRMMYGCDVVIHLAAVMGVERCTQHPLTCLSVNITGTQMVLDAAVSRGVPHVLIASSSEVYGSAVGDMNEDSPLYPKSEYAVSKLAAEEFAKAYTKDYGIKTTAMRFFSIYGPGQVSQFVMSKFAQAVRQGEDIQVYGTGEQTRSFCHVTDAAGAVAQLAIQGKGGTYVVGNGEQPVTIGELADLFVLLGGRTSRVKRMNFVDTDRTEAREIFARHPDTSKLGKEIGYAPKVSLRKGIKDLLDYGQTIPEDWQESLIPDAGGTL